MKLLRSHVTEEFLAAFNEGLKCYLKGDWQAARGHLEAADRIMRDKTRGMNMTAAVTGPVNQPIKLVVTGDGPSLTLLRFMAETNWTPPKDWKGYRPLTSK